MSTENHSPESGNQKEAVIPNHSPESGNQKEAVFPNHSPESGNQKEAVFPNHSPESGNQKEAVIPIEATHAEQDTKHDKSNHREKSEWHMRGWIIVFVCLEAVVIIFYGFFVEPSKQVDVLTADKNNLLSQDLTKQIYPIYQDIHVMMLIGFGFLYTYQYRSAWANMSFNFFLLIWVIQISILLVGFFKMMVENHWGKIYIDIRTMIQADFAAAAVLISLGGVLGRFNIGQLLVMATIETWFYAPNLAVGEVSYVAIDMGGSMFIHTFGAYFGLACSLVYSWMEEETVKDHEHNKASYTTNLFAYIGTAFLWLFWPSFNGAVATGNAQHRVIVNTVFALTGSALAVFFLAPLKSHGKFKMELLLNATLAGGVAIGGTCDVLAKPWSAILVGFVSGILSFIGFEFISPCLQKRMRLYDTAGINNLHGMIGIYGAIVGIIVSAAATNTEYGPSLSIIFPAIKDGRTFSLQAQMQLAALGTTICFAVVGGLVTGFILRIKCCFDGAPKEEMFSDLPFFEELEEVNGKIEVEGILVKLPPPNNQIIEHPPLEERPIIHIELQEMNDAQHNGVNK